jgi:type I restriction enzyme S subunit
MSNFINIEIGELGTTITGKTPSSDFPGDFGYEYMFITPSDSFDNKTIYETNRYLSMEGLQKLKNKVLTPKSVLVSCIGSAMGKVTMNNSISITNQQINSILIDSKYDSDYIYYILKNNYKLLRNASSGSTALPMLNKTDFDKLKITIHKDKITQQKIAKVLSDLDAKIELNNKINDNLELMAKTLYDYWFVQFDFPDANGKPYKTCGGKMVWDEELKREIPEGWEVQPLNKVIVTILDHRGKTPKKLGSDWTEDENGIIALSAKIVKDGKLINLNHANKVSKDLYDKWMQIKLIDGDILMTSEAPAGEFYFIQGKTDYCMSQRLFGIRANQLKMVPSYLYYELSKGNGYSQIMGSLSGSTVFGIRQDVLRKILVVVPDLEIQKEFNEIVLPMMKQIKQMDEQNQELASLRDWLLPMLMNGQVSVGEFEEELRMVAEGGAEYNSLQK